MIHPNLVAVDFSRSSLAAATWAGTHFGRGAELELAHAAGPAGLHLPAEARGTFRQALTDQLAEE